MESFNFLMKVYTELNKKAEITMQVSRLLGVKFILGGHRKSLYSCDEVVYVLP